MTPPDIQTVNPNAAHETTPDSIGRVLWRHRHLISQMTRRDVLGRYKGSFMGIAWSLFNPILMLSVYTFVFSEIFKARWGQGDEGKVQFAMFLFSGMIVFSLFSEILNRAPMLIVSNPNFVKKVVFPLEILPASAVLAAIFHSMISLSVLWAALLFDGSLNWTAIFLPLVFFPFVMLLAGLACMLASIGVFLRDAGQTVGMLTTVLLFLSPVFYPMSAVPDVFHPLMNANPLTFIIEQTRDILILGRMPNWWGLAIYSLAAALVLWGGYFWFQKTRKGFSDVL